MSTKTKTGVNTIRLQILEALEEIDRPAKFCSFGDRDFVMPGLEIKPLGTIGLPLSKPQTRELIEVCRQAPYGKGTDTVVDTEVRKVWELDANKIKFGNKKWMPFVDSILKHVQSELGLEQHELSAKLYKLLVYETGGFFLPHRDGEKLNGMVATLVICLPTKHQGGELIVTHHGKRETACMFGAAAGTDISYAAFYADCEHEVKPVKSGFRICLSYNVSVSTRFTTNKQHKSSKRVGKKKKRAPVSKANPIKAPDFSDATSKLTQLLEKLSADITALEKDNEADSKTTSLSGNDEARYSDVVAITLDHRYSQNSLDMDLLKGADQARR